MSSIRIFLLFLLFLHTSLFPTEGHWHAFVSNYGDNTINEIDTETLAVLNTITAGDAPNGIELSSDGKYAYVANTHGSSFTRINLQTYATDTIGVGLNPQGLALTPDNTKAVVTSYLTSSAYIIDLVSFTVIDTVDVGGLYAREVAISPDGTKVFIALSNPTGAAKVAYFLLNDPAHVTNINVGSCPTSVIFAPNGEKVYVTNFYNPFVSEVDVNTFAVTNIPAVTHLWNIAITPDGSKLFVTRRDEGEVYRIDTSTYVVSGPISVGGSTRDVAITPDGKRAFVSNYSENAQVSVIDTSTLEVTKSASFGNLQMGISITPDQAPTANFTSDIATLGSESLFDASSSTTPVGSITTYAWDFGDGESSSTVSSSIKHAYLATGNFDVTLTVTNSGNTSLIKTFTGRTMSNVGDERAQMKETINISTTPNLPQHCKGTISHHPHHGPYRFSIHLRWDKSSTFNISRYEIYKNHHLIASTAPDASQKHVLLLHNTHYKKKKEMPNQFFHRLHNMYKVRAVDTQERASNFVHYRFHRPD